MYHMFSGCIKHLLQIITKLYSSILNDNDIVLLVKQYIFYQLPDGCLTSGLHL